MVWYREWCAMPVFKKSLYDLNVVWFKIQIKYCVAVLGSYIAT